MSTLLLAWLVIAGAVFIQRVTAFGFGLVATPLLLALDHQFVPFPVLILTVLLMSVTLAAEGVKRSKPHGAGPGEPTDVAVARSRRDGWPLQSAIFACIPGVMLGTPVASLLPQAVVQITVGTVVVLSAGLSVFRLRLPRSRLALTCAGFIGGVLTPLTATPGPPVVLTYHDMLVSRREKNLSSYFLIVSLLALLPLILAPTELVDSLHAAVLLLPGVALGLAVWPFARYLKRPRFVQCSAQALCICVGVVLLLRGVLGL